MHHIMFDVDGTLVQSWRMDEACFLDSVTRVLGEAAVRCLDTHWSGYPHVTVAGILDHLLLQLGLQQDQKAIHQAVKQEFVQGIRCYLSKHPIEEIKGAARFIQRLKEIDNVSLSIATGGWLDSARLKLESADIDISGIPVASSDDHYARVEIMRIAGDMAGVTQQHSITYFGDAVWDKQSCSELGYNFVLVGDRTSNPQKLDDLTSVHQALDYIGLQS